VIVVPAGVELTANDLPPAAPGSKVGVTVAPVGAGGVVGVRVTEPPGAGVAVSTVGSGVFVRTVAVTVLVTVGVKEGPVVAVDVAALVDVGSVVDVLVTVTGFTTAGVVVRRIESPVSAEKTSLSRSPPRWNAMFVGPDPMTWKVIVTRVNGVEGAGAGGGACPAWKSAVPAGLDERDSSCIAVPGVNELTCSTAGLKSRNAPTPLTGWPPGLTRTSIVNVLPTGWVTSAGDSDNVAVRADCANNVPTDHPVDAITTARATPAVVSTPAGPLINRRSRAAMGPLLLSSICFLRP